MIKLGDRAIYRPRVPYGRQSELFCFVTRIVDLDRGMVDLIAFPANSEPLHLSNIVPKSDVIQIHCWELHGDDKRIGLTQVAQQAAQVELNEELKRGPGRPRKTEAA